MTMQEKIATGLNDVAYEFMTAGGLNSPEQITDLIGNRSVTEAAASLADEAAENWDLHVSPADLAEAIADFIETRPDIDQIGD